MFCRAQSQQALELTCKDIAGTYWDHNFSKVSQQARRVRVHYSCMISNRNSSNLGVAFVELEDSRAAGKIQQGSMSYF